jgi:hypothetical protein
MWTLFILSILGCGKKLPATLSNPTDVEHPECSHGSHYYAVGIANTSEDARLKSQSAISAQIQSSIESELQVETKSTDITTRESEKRRRTKTNSSYSEETNIFDQSFARTSFAFADLITIVQGPLEYQDQYYVLSCLHKRNASKRISETLRGDIDELKGFYSLSQTALQDGNTPNFSSAYRQFMSLYDELVPTFYVLRSLGRRASSAESEVYPLKKKMEEEAQKIRNQSIFALRMKTDDPNPEYQSGLLNIRTGIQASLKEIGLNAISTTSLCENPNSFDMEVQMNPLYNKGPMGGWIFAPQLEVIITQCSVQQQPKKVFALSNSDFNAYNSRDKTLAYQELIQKASQPLFTEDLRTQLQLLLPL